MADHGEPVHVLGTRTSAVASDEGRLVDSRSKMRATKRKIIKKRLKQAQKC